SATVGPFDFSDPSDTITVTADSTAVIDEEFEDNNSLQNELSIPVMPEPDNLPDLVITDAWTCNGTIYYAIANWGTGDAPSSQTEIYVHNQFWDMDSVGPLAAGEIRIESFCATLCSPCAVATLRADYMDNIAELNECNNATIKFLFSFTLPCCCMTQSINMPHADNRCEACCQ
ncbi:MAG: CARDB domain-containing protein, partial [Chloroflexota bacterium]|nr:CARDB domain-containing protein [Chloroflexota bacterium]